MSNIGAEFTASIIINKNDVVTQALKQLSTVQRELENNKLEIFFDLSNADFTKELKKFQKQLSKSDYTIKVQNQGVEETVKNIHQLIKLVNQISSGKPLNIGNNKSFIDSSSTINQLNKLEQKVTEISKKYDDLKKKQISTNNQNISGKNVDIVDNEEFKRLSKEVHTATNEIGILKESISKLAKDNTSINSFINTLDGRLNKVSNTVVNLTNNILELQNISKKINIPTANNNEPTKNILTNTNTTNNNQQKNNLSDIHTKALQINDALNKTQSIIDGLSKEKRINPNFDTLSTQVAELNNKLKNGNMSLGDYNKAIKEITSKYSNDIKNDLSNINNLDKITSNMKDVIDKYNVADKKNFKPSSEYLQELSILQTNYSKLSQLQTEVKNKNVFNTNEIEDYNSHIKELVTSSEKAKKTLSNMSANEKGSPWISRDKLDNQISEYMKKFSGMSKEFKNQLKELQGQLRNQGSSANVSQLTDEFIKIKIKIREAGQETRNFFDIFKDKALYGFISKLSMYYLSMYDFIRYARNAITTVVDLDTALIDLQKTTKMNSNELEDFYYDSNNISRQMGVTTKEIIEQASAWSRLSYSTKEMATEMAQLSSQFASISPGMDTDQAQEGLVSIMKSWDISYDKVKSEIMDNINTLGNNFAESNADIVEGMKRSASALAAVGTSYEDAFALFTGIQEILQNAEVAGRALRSISMRVRGYDESSTDGFEEVDESLKNITGDLIDLTKTAKHTEGVSIFKEGSSTDFKRFVDYFDEIHDIWDEMSEKQQSDYLQQAFGKTQANKCA